jgi:mannitol 2-dehydrogenase
MSCDNLPHNGEVARRMLCAFARLKDPVLAAWIETEVAFPNCLVDRITPVTAQEDIDRLADEFGVVDASPVVCEPFAQWVLEDRFSMGRPALEDAGVQLVGDVVPYELMKLRLLNASHQALCYLGHLSGYRYLHEVCQDPLFVSFLLGYLEREGSPTLPRVPGVDLNGYRQQLVERFANPEVRDSLARLCAESSDQIAQWLLPVVKANLAVGGEIERSALVLASWARYAEGVREQRQQEDGLAFLRDSHLFGDLADSDRFTAVYAEARDSLDRHGARATLEQLVLRKGDPYILTGSPSPLD